MKIRIYYVLHKLWLVIALLCVLLAVTLSVGRAVTPLLQEHRGVLQSWASEALDQPVQIGEVSAGWHYFQPMVHFSDVTVFNDPKTHALLHVQDLTVTLDIWRSLLERRIQVGKLIVSGAHLAVREEASGHVTIDGISALMGSSINQGRQHSFDELLNWLFSQNQVGVDRIAIDWHRPDAHVVKLRNIAISIINGRLSHRLTGKAVLMMAKPSELRFALNIRGNFLQRNTLKIHAYLDTGNLAIANWLEGLGDLHAIFANALLPDEILKVLTELKPQGNLKQLHISNSKKDPDTYIVDIEFDKLSWRRWQDIPGVTGLSGKAHITGKSGVAVIQSQNATVDFGKIFRKTLSLDQLNAKINWKQEGKEWQIQAPDFSLSNADIASHGALVLKVPVDTGSPWLSALAQFQLKNLRDTSRYLPVTVIPADVVTWLDHAIVDGKGATGSFLLRGNLSDFPFDKGTGRFIVDANFQGLTLDYQEGWPAIKEMDTHVVFSNRSLTIKSEKGKVMDIPYQQLLGVIADLGEKPVLSVRSKAASDLANALRFIRESPLQETMGNNFEQLAMQGPMSLDLQLTIPLGPPPTRVQGVVTLPNARVEISKWKLVLSKLRGQIKFTQDTVSGEALQGELLEQPVRLDISKTSEAALTDIAIAGKVTVEALSKQWPNVDFSSYVKGAASYNANLYVAHADLRSNHFEVLSDLEGVEINLPPPLGKSYKEKRSSKVDIVFIKDGIKSANIRYGNNFFVFAEPYSKGEWSAHVVSPQAQGTLIIPENKQGIIRGDFPRLYLDFRNDKFKRKLEARDVPSMTLRCEDCRYNGKVLGSVDLALNQQENGVDIHRFNLKTSTYNLESQGAWRSLPSGEVTTLTGQINSSSVAQVLKNWELPQALVADQGKLKFELRWPNAPNNFEFVKSTGTFDLQFGNGQILDVGHEAQEKVGLGRLLTLLSLQSLPRRLSLDFRDLTNKGFNFDDVHGTFALSKGMLSTSNTLLEGTVARILMQGHISITKKMFDLTLKITPHVTSSLPVVAAIAGGPAAGALTWVAEKVLSDPVQAIATRTYHITGPWSKPVIEEVK